MTEGGVSSQFKEWTKSVFQRYTYIKGKEMRLVVRFIVLLSLTAIVVIPLSFASADQPEASPVRALPDIVLPGATFNVTVNFTSPLDTFSTPVVTDHAPLGWTVEVGECQPPPEYVLATNDATDNKVEIIWKGNYPRGTNFTARYKVTIPGNASPGDYNFSGTLYFHYDPTQPFPTEPTEGDSHVYVSLPQISFSPGNISFSARQGGASPAEKEFEIWNSGGGTLNWTLNRSASWLGVDSTGGSSTAEHAVIAVSANITGMSAGNYSATINITAPAAGNSPQAVPVALHLSLPGAVVAGDANDDGEVNQDDVVMVRKIILGVAELTPGADCNKDGVVNALDITAIKRVILTLD